MPHDKIYIINRVSAFYDNKCGGMFPITSERNI